MTTTTWDSNAESGMTLSNSSLTATIVSNPPANSGLSVRSTTSRTTGKAYVEFTMGQVASNGGTQIGIATSAWDYTNSSTLGLDGNSFEYQSDGHIFVVGARMGSADTVAAGDIVQLCVDFDAQLFWVTKNNDGNWNGTSANPAAGTGGISFNAVSGSCFYVGYCSASGGNNVTVNFGGSSFSYTAPSGFSSWNTQTTQTTWDPNAESGMTLSSDSLTATVTASGTDGMSARSLTSWNTGKAYVEFAMGQVTSNGMSRVGITNSSWNYTQSETLGRDDYSCAYESNGYIFVANANVGTADNFAAGDTVQLCVDFDAQLFWVAKNNDGNWNGTNANPAAGTGGISFASIPGPWFVGYSSSTAGDNATANFGASALSHPPPSGFSTWGGGRGGGVNRPAALANYPHWKNYKNWNFGGHKGNALNSLPAMVSQGWIHTPTLFNGGSEVEQFSMDMTTANPNVQFPAGSNYCDFLAIWNGGSIVEASKTQTGQPNGNVTSMEVMWPFQPKYIPLTSVTYVEGWFKCPDVNGAWPAWWTTGQQMNLSYTVSNSNSATTWGPEIDFMEIIGPNQISSFNTGTLHAASSANGKELPNSCFLSTSPPYNIPPGTTTSLANYLPPSSTSGVPKYTLGAFRTVPGIINASNGYHRWGCLIEPNHNISIWIDDKKIGQYASTQYCDDGGKAVALNLIITLALSPRASKHHMVDQNAFGGANNTDKNNKFRLSMKNVQIWGPKP